MTGRDLNRAARTPEGAQEWLGMLQTLAQQIQRQQQNSQQMIQEMMDTYMQLLNTPGSYLSGQAEQQQQTLQQTAQQWMEQAQQQQQTFQQQAQQQQQAFQQMTQEVLSTYTQLFNIPALLCPGESAVRPVPHRRLRRADRGRGLRTSWRPLRRRASGSARLRGAQQEPRHDPRAARSQDKGRLLRSVGSKESTVGRDGEGTGINRFSDIEERKRDESDAKARDEVPKRKKGGASSHP